MNPLLRDHPRGAVKSGTRPSTLASSSAFVRRPSIRYFDRQLPPDRGPRKNEQIRITPIRLVGAEGEQLGIVPTSQALEKQEIKDFFLQHGVNSVAMSEGNMGCPHEEGLDFPHGEDCPFCPFWKGKQGSRARD
jgi:hypothetical protein